MLKKTLLLIGALAALAALPPAVASATWYMEGSAIGKNEELQIKGQIAVETEVGGIACKFAANGTLESGTTTGQTQFGVDGAPTTSCSTQGLLKLAGCTVESVQATGLPWTIHKSSEQTVALTTGAIHTGLVKHSGGACSPSSITLNAGNLNLHVASVEKGGINEGTLSGLLESSIGEVAVSGKGDVTPYATFGLTQLQQKCICKKVAAGTGIYDDPACKVLGGSSNYWTEKV